MFSRGKLSRQLQSFCDWLVIVSKIVFPRLSIDHVKKKLLELFIARARPQRSHDVKLQIAAKTWAQLSITREPQLVAVLAEMHVRHRTDETYGPATYYQIRTRGAHRFIGAMTNMHFCENCNKLRLTCDGKLRPCLGSYLEFDIMGPLRAGASDEQLKQFFLNVVDRKPREHDFRNNYQPIAK